jgi:predicted component of type VI protein secretion system
MRIVIEDEAGTRSIVPFETELVLGRDAGAGWRLGERNVSRRHARFLKTGSTVYVEDLGSRNGTFVNGERTLGRRRIRPGDLVAIGDYEVLVLPDGLEAQGPVPDLPPPLPSPSYPDLAAVTVPAPVGARPEPAPAAAAPSPVVARAARRRAVAVAAVGALAAGLAVGLLLARLLR